MGKGLDVGAEGEGGIKGSGLNSCGWMVVPYTEVGPVGEEELRLPSGDLDILVKHTNGGW